MQRILIFYLIRVHLKGKTVFQTVHTTVAYLRIQTYDKAKNEFISMFLFYPTAFRIVCKRFGEPFYIVDRHEFEVLLNVFSEITDTIHLSLPNKTDKYIN